MMIHRSRSQLLGRWFDTIMQAASIIEVRCRWVSSGGVGLGCVLLVHHIGSRHAS